MRFIISSLTLSRVRQKTVTIAVANAQYCVMNNSYLGIPNSSVVIQVYLPRVVTYNYAFVTGYAWDFDGNLWVYFDQTFNATVELFVYYIEEVSVD